MDKGLTLKRRILGGFITVLGVVVILPAFLDSSNYHEPLFADTPVMPEVPEWAQVADEQRVRHDLEQLANDEAKEAIAPPPMVVVEDDEVPVLIPTTEPKSNAVVASNSWVLQLGAFSEATNAYALRDRLRTLGYKAYTEEFPQAKLTRVYVGPEIQHADIKALQQKIQAELGLKDVHIKRWQPGR